MAKCTLNVYSVYVDTCLSGRSFFSHPFTYVLTSHYPLFSDLSSHLSHFLIFHFQSWSGCWNRGKMLENSSVVSCGIAMWSLYTLHSLKWIQTAHSVCKINHHFIDLASVLHSRPLSVSVFHLSVSQPLSVFSLHFITHISSFKLTHWKNYSILWII